MSGLFGVSICRSRGLETPKTTGKARIDRETFVEAKTTLELMETCRSKSNSRQGQESKCLGRLSLCVHVSITRPGGQSAGSSSRLAASDGWSKVSSG